MNDKELLTRVYDDLINRLLKQKNDITYNYESSIEVEAYLNGLRSFLGLFSTKGVDIYIRLQDEWNAIYDGLPSIELKDSNAA